MWSVSARFLTAIPQPHTIETAVTCTLPGGTVYPLRLVEGSWQVQSGQLIRRTADLTLEGGTVVYGRLSTPGAVIQIRHGIRWSGTEKELIPVFTGEMSGAATRLGDGTVQCSLADLGQRLARNNYLAPLIPAVSTLRVDAIANAVTTAMPTVGVYRYASDKGIIGVAQQWSSRTQFVQDLATDGGSEAFFQPDGSFVIRDAPKLSNEPVWTLKTGPGGTVGTAARNRPLDKLYNTVVVLPSSNDNSQGWTRQIVQITDTGNPRHPDRIGVSPYEWTSPTILTATDATAIAQQILSRVQGSTETLTVTAAANPALEAGDVVRLVTPTDKGPLLESHLIDTISGDLITGTMTCGTRAATEVLAA